MRNSETTVLKPYRLLLMMSKGHHCHPPGWSAWVYVFVVSSKKTVRAKKNWYLNILSFPTDKVSLPEGCTATHETPYLQEQANS